MQYLRLESRLEKSYLVWAFVALVVFSAAACGENDTLPCAESQIPCVDASSGVDYCATIATDNANCGACGLVCTAGTLCSGGQCIDVCAPNWARCNDHCVDPLTDRFFCDATNDCMGEHAGTACALGQACFAGVCKNLCAPGLQDNDGDNVCSFDCAHVNLGCVMGSCGDDTGTTICVCTGGYTGELCDSCASGTQDNDYDGVCTPTCETAALSCPLGTFCDDSSGTANCVSVPTTCAQIRQLDPTAADGEYMLFHNAEPARGWQAYCHDMAGTPSEYLTLAALGPNKNFSLIAHFDAPDTDVRTEFMRVRIDPATLIVKVDDFTFSNSTGIITGWNKKRIEYGHATACGWGDGAANVDLTGTPFVLDETFCVGAGWGTITPSPDGKSVNITAVNGWCGGVTPCTQNDQGWRIHLALP